MAVDALARFAPVVGVGHRSPPRRSRRSHGPAGRRARRSPPAPSCPRRCSRRTRTSSSGRSGRWASREINKAITAGTFPPLPSPVREDGPGWRAEVDLPYGVTATQVIERREQLASGLRRPLGAVWPEPVTSEHAGRLELWVGRADVSKAKPAPWPWLRTGGGDIFAPFPFGTDPRGRRADGHMIEHNWLIGSMPGQGKTSAVRVLVRRRGARSHRRAVAARAEGHRRP